jgi:hypothetical protein
VRVLFDQGTPAPLRYELAGHDVETAFEYGWSRMGNGELLAAAEQAGFEVFVSTDRNLRHQQNLAARRLAIVVLLSTSWPRIERCVRAVDRAVALATPGSYLEVEIE